MKKVAIFNMIFVTLFLIFGCGETSSISNINVTETKSETDVLYLIDFDLNGGYSASYNGKISISKISNEYFFFDCVKEGWNFRGWSYNNELIFDEFGNKLLEIELQNNMIFVAEYSQTVKLKIITNMNDAGEICGEGEYPYNCFATISVKVKKGFYFIGWYEKDILVTESKEYKYIVLEKDVIIEARFKYDSFCLTISSYQSNFGSVLLINDDYKYPRDLIIENINYMSNCRIAAYSTSSVSFLGWFDKYNQIISNDEIYLFNMPNEDYDLIAKWDYFTIDYDLNGGSSNNKNPKYYTYEKYEIVLEAPTKSGYDFSGWLDTSSGLIISKIQCDKAVNLKLKATWKATKYNIVYHLNGGTNGANPSTYTIESNDIYLKDAIRTGYNFSGWYTNENYTNNIVVIKKGSRGDIHLWAKWIAIEYEITYDLKGGENDKANPSKYTIEDTIVFKDATKFAHSFNGWQDSYGNFVSSINPGTIGNIMLTASWGYTNEDTAYKEEHGIILKYYENEQKITYGLYPKSLVEDSKLINSLEKSNDKDEILGWNKVDDEYYQKIRIGSTEYGWFKGEKISWKIYNKGKLQNGLYWYSAITENIIDFCAFTDNLEYWMNSRKNSHNGGIDYRENGFTKVAFFLNDEYISQIDMHLPSVEVLSQCFSKDKDRQSSMTDFSYHKLEYRTKLDTHTVDAYNMHLNHFNNRYLTCTVAHDYSYYTISKTGSLNFDDGDIYEKKDINPNYLGIRICATFVFDYLL